MSERPLVLEYGGTERELRFAWSLAADDMPAPTPIGASGAMRRLNAALWLAAHVRCTWPNARDHLDTNGHRLSKSRCPQSLRRVRWRATPAATAQGSFGPEADMGHNSSRMSGGGAPIPVAAILFLQSAMRAGRRPRPGTEARCRPKRCRRSQMLPDLDHKAL